MSSCTLWGEQAAWRCWSTVAMRTTGRPHVSPLPHLSSLLHLHPAPIHITYFHPCCAPQFTSVLSLCRCHHLFFLNLLTGFLHPSILSSILSSIQPTYIFTHPPWQIIPTSVLSHLRRRPALPLFILTTIPAHLLSRPVAKHPTLTSSSFFSRTSSHPSAVPRSSSNLENTERKRVKTRLKKLIMKRPPLQALQEKGLIKGENRFQCCPASCAGAPQGRQMFSSFRCWIHGNPVSQFSLYWTFPGKLNRFKFSERVAAELRWLSGYFSIYPEVLPCPNANVHRNPLCLFGKSFLKLMEVYTLFRQFL